MTAGTNSLTDTDYEREFEVEALLGRMSDLIEVAIADSGLSKQEVAELCNVTPGRISQIISGEENLTLRVIAETAFAVGQRVEPAFTPIVNVASTLPIGLNWQFDSSALTLVDEEDATALAA